MRVLRFALASAIWVIVWKVGIITAQRPKRKCQSEYMYSRIQLCPSLTPKYKCIRVQEYDQGKFVERVHRHVPKHKLAWKNYWALLRTLVLRYEEATDEQIVNAYLVRRGRDAKRYHHGAIRVEYPEPGVHRSYCGENVLAWIDTVVLPEDFRPVLAAERTLLPSISAPF